MDDVERLLEEITNASGPTGFEGPVRSIMQRELSPLCDEMETDGIGSLIGRLGEGSDRPRVMMAAHMDEVGLMVRFITAEGYIKFQTLGGWLDQALINQRWVIQTRNGPVAGVSGIKTVHVMTPEARTQIFKREQIFHRCGSERPEGRRGAPGHTSRRSNITGQQLHAPQRRQALYGQGLGRPHWPGNYGRGDEAPEG